MRRVSDFIADYLVKIGVPQVFLVSGGGIMHILDGFACNKNIHVTCHHHEQAAAIAANGYARVTNHLGVVVVTTGPGSTNAITAVADAWVDSIPMLVISGQSKRSQNIYNYPVKGLRSIGGQEINIIPMIKSCTKYAEMINSPEDIRYHLERAVYEATHGRPGPVWLDVPLDVQAAIIDETTVQCYVPPHPAENPIILKIHVFDVLQSLIHSERPVIIAGHGIKLAHAEKEFLELVNTLKIPVVVSKLGHGLLDEETPYYIGFGGTKGTRAANFTIQNADLIISIGSRLAIPFTGYDFTQFARNAKKMVVDIDLTELNKNTVTIDSAIQADAKDFITEFLNVVKNKDEPVSKSEWMNKCIEWKHKYQSVTAEQKEQTNPISIYNLFDKLSEALDENATIVADAGSTYYTITQAFRVKQGQKILVTSALGAMGFSLPMAIGAYYANPKNTIVAVTGDGSLQMNIQELQTIAHNNIPIKLFVINNGEYASIRNTQNLYFNGRKCGADKESGVSCPDLQEIARAYKIPYGGIYTNSHLPLAIRLALNTSSPKICEVFTDPAQQTIPNVGSQVLPDGSMISSPLEDMSPLLSREEFHKEMIIKPIR